MAVAAPLLALGASNAGLITAIAGFTAVGSGLLSAKASRDAGYQQAYQMRAEAAKEGDSARQREIERKRTLLRALSQQSANAAAGGIRFDGSVASIARTDIRDATNDLLVDRSNTNERVAGLKRGAKNAIKQGNLQAAASLFDTATKAAGMM